MLIPCICLRGLACEHLSFPVLVWGMMMGYRPTLLMQLRSIEEGINLLKVFSFLFPHHTLLLFILVEEWLLKKLNRRRRQQSQQPLLNQKNPRSLSLIQKASRYVHVWLCLCCNFTNSSVLEHHEKHWKTMK